MTKLDAKFCYELLDLKPGATQAQIKEAYRKLAMQWHPDRYAHDPKLQANAEEKIKIINAANEFLKTYKFGSAHPSQPEQAARADKNKQTSHEAEQRKQAAERQRQKVQQEETERRRQQAERWQQAERGKREAERKKQEAEQRIEAARQQERERGKRETARRKQLAEQPEKERQERQERWRKENEENLRMQKEKERIQKEKEAKLAHELEQLAQMPKQVTVTRHYFEYGRCKRCGRTKASLTPGSQCLGF